MGCDNQSIRMQKPGGRRGKLRNRGSRTPEGKRGTATDAPVVLSGVLRGWADCEQGPALGGRSRTGGSPPKRAFGSFWPRPKGTRPGGRNLVVAKSALLRFHPRTAKTALRFLAPPLPTETADAGFRRGPQMPVGAGPDKWKCPPANEQTNRYGNSQLRKNHCLSFRMVREMRFFLSSTSFTHTVTTSPTLSTSEGCLR